MSHPSSSQRPLSQEDIVTNRSLDDITVSLSGPAPPFTITAGTTVPHPLAASSAAWQSEVNAGAAAGARQEPAFPSFTGVPLNPTTLPNTSEENFYGLFTQSSSAPPQAPPRPSQVRQQQAPAAGFRAPAQAERPNYVYDSNHLAHVLAFLEVKTVNSDRHFPSVVPASDTLIRVIPAEPKPEGVQREEGKLNGLLAEYEKDRLSALKFVLRMMLVKQQICEQKHILKVYKSRVAFKEAHKRKVQEVQVETKKKKAKLAMDAARAFLDYEASIMEEDQEESEMTD